MTGLPRKERVRVVLEGRQLEAIRFAAVHAATGTAPTPNYGLAGVAFELDVELERLDVVAERQNVHSAAFENLHAVKFGKGVLYGFTVYNSKASSQFIHIFDNNKAPATGDVPAVLFTVAATTNLGVEWIHGRNFSSGCFIANSSTDQTYTAGAADCFFDVQFI